MNSKSGTVGFNHKRKAAPKRQSLVPDRTRQDMLEEEDESMEMTNIEETDDNEDAPSLLPPKVPGNKKKQSPRTMTSSLEESDNEDSLPPKKSGKKKSASRTLSLGAVADEMDQGYLDFSMNSPEFKSVSDRQSPVIELGGCFSVLEVDSPIATKSVTIKRRRRRTDGEGFSDYLLHVPFRRLPPLALASLQYCSIVPEINAIIKNDSNFISRLKVIQKKLLTISSK